MRILNSFILLMLAIVLGMILLPVAFLFETFSRIMTYGLAEYWYKCARSVDQSANAIGGYFFSLLFIYPRNRDYTMHGNEDVTISHCLAKNYQTNNLSIAGKFLYNILELLDPGHGERAIEEDE